MIYKIDLSLDLKNPKMLHINGSGLQINKESNEMKDVMNLWNSVWSKVPPTLHKKSAFHTFQDGPNFDVHANNDKEEL